MVASVLGILNWVFAQLLYDCLIPWSCLNWLHGLRCRIRGRTCVKGRPCSTWPLIPRPFAVAALRFRGELLPYTALRAVRNGDERRYGQAPAFVKDLAEYVEKLVGERQALPDAEQARHYDDMASDAVKAWVISRIGVSIGADAWKHAAAFRLLDNVYRSMSFAMPAFLLAALVRISLEGSFPPWGVVLTVLAGLMIGALLSWYCQVKALVCWVQWQGELCRIFHVAHSRKAEEDPTSRP